MCVDFERPDFYSECTRTARRQHMCCECAREIAAAETYSYAFLVYDGAASSFRTCAHCDVGHRWLSENCGGFLFTQLAEEMEEHAEEYRQIVGFDMARIIVGMRRRWQRYDGLGLSDLPRMPRSIDESALASDRHG